LKGNLEILPQDYLEIYKEKAGVDWTIAINSLKTKSSFSKEDFEYYLQSSAVYSSNIEGNSIDFDSYLKNKRFKIKSKPKETAEIDDLLEAYNFAVNEPLTKENFFESHRILSQSILSLKSQRGKLRTQPVGIFSKGKIEYMAIEPEFLKEEFDKLFEDIKTLFSEELTNPEIFYFASMIHLLFEKIHPFMDGNGRAGRLLEKWFLASKIGESAWSIPSEQYYFKNRSSYYENIHIGLNYYVIKMEKCIPFLLMLVNCLRTSIK
jgi:Fic family protein